MHIRSVRVGGSDKSTESDVFVDDVFFCYALEDVVRSGPKVHGKTAIPEGTYRVSSRFSPHFKRRVLWLTDVAGYEYILVHAGNSDIDTEGCILVGMDQTSLKDDWIGRSREAEDKLYKLVAPKLEHEAVWWTVTRAADFKAAA